MDKAIETIATFIFALAVVAMLVGLSWITVCGIIKLITLCFGLTFSFKIATGIWLTALLFRWIIGAAKGKE